MAQQTILSGSGVLWDAEKVKINANFTEVYTHTSSTSNPHSVGETDVLPSQTGNSGKYLTTNGTTTSWGTPSGGSGGLTWSVITGATTAVSGNGYLVNSSAAVTVTLPASPSVGNIVSIVDGSGNSETYNITIARNSEPIMGAAADKTIAINEYGCTLVYMNASRGWVIVYEVNEVSW